MKNVKNFFEKIINILKKIEEILLIFFLSLIIIISSLQIILTNFFKGISWFDSILKYGVLWLGFIAASIATTENKHIKIDIIGKFARGSFKSLIYFINNLFSGLICILLSILSIYYILNVEFFSKDPPPFLNLKKWILIIVIPFCFFIIGLKLFLSSIKCFIYFIKKEEIKEEYLLSFRHREEK